jgi:hypothetical protein
VIKVFLAGEGATELGGWSREKVYRDPTPATGVLEALLKKVRPSGWIVVEAICWKSIRKYQARPKMSAELRNVLGVALHAKEVGAEVLAFTRDRDRDTTREAEISEGIARSVSLFEPCPRIVGGVAIEAIEAWTLALHGQRRGHRHPRPKEELAAASITDQIAVVEAASLDNPDLDAPSLKSWIERARAALAP